MDVFVIEWILVVYGVLLLVGMLGVFGLTERYRSGRARDLEEWRKAGSGQLVRPRLVWGWAHQYKPGQSADVQKYLEYWFGVGAIQVKEYEDAFDHSWAEIEVLPGPGTLQTPVGTLRYRVDRGDWMVRFVGAEGDGRTFQVVADLLFKVLLEDAK